MAYDSKELYLIGVAGASGIGNGIKIWGYDAKEDSITTVAAANYFDAELPGGSVGGKFTVGDMIIVKAADAMYKILFVTSVTTHVTTQFFNNFEYTGSIVNIGTHALRVSADNAAPLDANLVNGSFVTWIDNSGNALTFKVKYPDGTVKSGTVALT